MGTILDKAYELEDEREEQRRKAKEAKARKENIKKHNSLKYKPKWEQQTLKTK